MKNFLTIGILCLILLSGCASVKMQREGITALDAGPTKAKIVFLRHSFVGSAISASVFDVTEEDEKFIGILANATKVEYVVDPGKYLLMVIGENADFLAANVVAGKTYYTITTPRFGYWKARFSLWPIRNGSTGEYTTKSKEFQTWLNDTLVAKGPKADNWYRQNRPSIISKRDAYIKKWNAKSEEDKQIRSLMPGDGIPHTKELDPKI